MSPVKTRTDFLGVVLFVQTSPLFCNCPNISLIRIFRWKKWYRLLHFQANKHKLALLCNVTKIVLATTFKEKNESSSKCKCIHVLLIWAKFYCKIPLGQWFLKSLVTRIFWMLFLCWFMVVLVYTDVVQVSYRNSYVKVLRMVGSMWTHLCTNRSEK